jgi:hypothetical protein
VLFLTWYLIVRAGRGAVDVHRQRQDQTCPDDPEGAFVGEHRLAERAKVSGIAVVGLTTRERLQVAVHVHEREADEGDAADGHQNFQEDGAARCPRAPYQSRGCH